MQCQGPTCTREIEQIPGSHRPRIYCSDRCRMAARRLRIRGVEQAQIQQVEARTRKEREKVAHRFGLLTEASLDLLVELGHRDPKLARMVGQALARERDQALANQKRAEQERSIYQDILQEAASTADARYCFIEADVSALDDSGRHW